MEKVRDLLSKDATKTLKVSYHPETGAYVKVGVRMCMTMCECVCEVEFFVLRKGKFFIADVMRPWMKINNKKNQIGKYVHISIHLKELI